MDILLEILGLTFACVIWFIVVIKIAKYTVGKDASTPLMFTIMILAGPIGWAGLAFAFAWEMIEKISKDKD